MAPHTTYGHTMAINGDRDVASSHFLILRDRKQNQGDKEPNLNALQNPFKCNNLALYLLRRLI